MQEKVRSSGFDAPVHLITAGRPDGWASVIERVRAALEGGVRVVQYRHKTAPVRQMMEELATLVKMCRASDTALIVNDRLDVALAAGAAGVHLGWNDLPWTWARQHAPVPFVLGCTAASPERVAEAIAAGADYVGAGPAYATTTKKDTGPRLAGRDYAALALACRRRASSPLPLVAVGGIGPGRAAGPVEAGADAVAVSSAILDAADPARVAHDLTQEVVRARLARTATGPEPR
ncbi:MAG: thiamine phosphate synthase [Acidobacteriota bacterium]|nr:MAG: thiamine phosphate synthase [Acidobacteriota bacterium]